MDLTLVIKANGLKRRHTELKTEAKKLQDQIEAERTKFMLIRNYFLFVYFLTLFFWPDFQINVFTLTNKIHFVFRKFSLRLFLIYSEY